MLYDVGRDGNYLPQFKNITIENLTSSGGEYGIFMEAFEEVPITGLVFRNVNISNVGTDIRALNWEDPVMENVTINGKTYPRPVETKILGVPVPGQRIEGSSTLLGGEDTDLSSKWLISDSADGDYHFFRIPPQLCGSLLSGRKVHQVRFHRPEWQSGRQHPLQGAAERRDRRHYQ